jgi:hypothetical protein
MARAFAAADLIQFATGTAGTGTVGAATATITLPSPTTEGNTVLILLRNLSFTALADQWDMSVTENTIPALSILSRVGVPAGESSWTLALSTAGSSAWVWRVEEWQNIAYLPVVSASTAGGLAPAPATLSTGNTSSFTGEEYVMAVALFSFFKSPDDNAVWPTIGGYTNGFTSVDVIDNGDGTGLSDQRLAVARYYGTSGQNGPLETTATFTGTRTAVNSQAALAVFRAAEVVTVDAPVVLSNSAGGVV